MDANASCGSLVGNETAFCGAFRNQPSKVVFTTVSTVLAVADIALLYGSVWFERFGSDNK
jgi:hypothetical protein